MSLLSRVSPRLGDFKPRFEARLAAEQVAQPLGAAPLLVEADLAGLPPPVQRFVRRSGALGRPRVQRFRAEFEAEFLTKPGARPMAATSVQVNFLGRPARFFLMQARMAGLPVQALHLYGDARATFQVRVASLLNMVDQGGEVLSQGETVTLLNDLCFLAPGALVDPRIGWRAIDDRSAEAIFTNGPHRVSARLLFNARDELADFVSEDRPEFSEGAYHRHPWSTPVESYGELAGMRLPSRVAVTYRRPGGDFTYGRFVLRSIAYDAAAGG